MESELRRWLNTTAVSWTDDLDLGEKAWKEATRQMQEPGPCKIHPQACEQQRKIPSKPINEIECDTPFTVETYCSACERESQIINSLCTACKDRVIMSFGGTHERKMG